jgi:hypothetical protein
LNQNEKWAKELSSQCGVNPTLLKDLLEELGESCYGDAATSKKVLEELTLSCHLNEEELMKFVKDVSKSCPLDAKKLLKEILKAEGDKDKVLEYATNESTRWPADRSGVR